MYISGVCVEDYTYSILCFGADVWYTGVENPDTYRGFHYRKEKNHEQSVQFFGRTGSIA